MKNESLGLSSLQVALLAELFADGENVARLAAQRCAELARSLASGASPVVLSDDDRVAAVRGFEEHERQHQRAVETLKWARAQLIVHAQAPSQPTRRMLALPPAPPPKRERVRRV